MPLQSDATTWSTNANILFNSVPWLPLVKKNNLNGNRAIQWSRKEAEFDDVRGLFFTTERKKHNERFHSKYGQKKLCKNTNNENVPNICIS